VSRGRKPPGLGVLPGSKNTANAHQGSPVTGETCRPPSSVTSALGVPNPKPPGLPRRRLDGAGAKAQAQGGIAGRAQESGETGRQESESFIVPWKPGHSPWEDPAEGREGRVTDLLSGHRARTPSLGPLFTKRQRIAYRGMKP
jgi:hypothetical protein